MYGLDYVDWYVDYVGVGWKCFLREMDRKILEFMWCDLSLKKFIYKVGDWSGVTMWSIQKRTTNPAELNSLKNI